MTEQHRTLLDDLDETHVGTAPVQRLVTGGRAIKRRRQRTTLAGAVAATALVIGGGAVLTTQGLSGRDGSDDVPQVAGAPAGDLKVTVQTGVPVAAPDVTAESSAEDAALWNADDQTVVYVSGLHYSGTCPPDATAEVNADGAVNLVVFDIPYEGVCTANAGPVTVTIKGMSSPPKEMTVTDAGDTSTVPVVVVAVKDGLIEVKTDDGKPGYAHAEDMYWAPASNPAEAIRLTKEHVDANGDIIIPVYEADGTTRIGEFTAGHVN